jgi:hypothetical protein
MCVSSDCEAVCVRQCERGSVLEGLCVRECMLEIGSEHVRGIKLSGKRCMKQTTVRAFV